MNIIKLIALLAIAVPSLSFAGKATNTFKSSVKMTGVCFISAPNVNFGLVDSQKKGTGTVPMAYWNTLSITVKCNNKIPYVITGKPYVQQGQATAQFLTGQAYGEQLSYGIWTGPNATGNWFADGARYSYGVGQSAVTGGISGTGTGSNAQHNLYFGLYPQIGSGSYPGKLVKADTYSDNYQLTITY